MVLPTAPGVIGIASALPFFYLAPGPIFEPDALARERHPAPNTRAYLVRR